GDAIGPVVKVALDGRCGEDVWSRAYAGVLLDGSERMPCGPLHRSHTAMEHPAVQGLVRACNRAAVDQAAGGAKRTSFSAVASPSEVRRRTEGTSRGHRPDSGKVCAALQRFPGFRVYIHWTGFS